MKQEITKEINFHDNQEDFPVCKKAFVDKIFSLINFKEGAKVLDAGCGNGYWGKEFLRREPSLIIYGVDISEKSLDEARRGSSKNETYIRGSLLEKLPFEEDTFDYVFFGGILHHFPSEKELDAVIKNSSFASKHDSNLIALEPNGSNPAVSISRLLGKLFSKIYPCIGTENETAHTTKAYKRVLAKNGLEIINTNFYRNDRKGKHYGGFLGVALGFKKVLFDLAWYIFPQMYGGNEVVIIANKYEI